MDSIHSFIHLLILVRVVRTLDIGGLVPVITRESYMLIPNYATELVYIARGTQIVKQYQWLACCAPRGFILPSRWT